MSKAHRYRRQSEALVRSITIWDALCYVLVHRRRLKKFPFWPPSAPSLAYSCYSTLNKLTHNFSHILHTSANREFFKTKKRKKCRKIKMISLRKCQKLYETWYKKYMIWNKDMKYTIWYEKLSNKMQNYILLMDVHILRMLHPCMSHLIKISPHFPNPPPWPSPSTLPLDPGVFDAQPLLRAPIKKLFKTET